MSKSLIHCVSRSVSIAITSAAISLSASTAFADSLQDDLAQLLETHDRVRAAQSDASAAHERATAAGGMWYPTVSLTANYGYEIQRKGQGVADTYIPPREIDIALSQQVWDFGSTDATIDGAVKGGEMSDLMIDIERQTLLFQGITTYTDLMIARRNHRFAIASQNTINAEVAAEFERLKVKGGKRTDVLQARKNLHNAEAIRSQRAYALRMAENRYRSLFKKDPETVPTTPIPDLDPAIFPGTLDEVIAKALISNPQILAAQLGADIARADINRTEADTYYPKVNMSAEQRWKNDVGGTIGGKTEQIVKVEMTYSMNLGLTGINTLRASEHGHSAAVARMADARATVETSARDAWKTLHKDFEELALHQNKILLLDEYLELARDMLLDESLTAMELLGAEAEVIAARTAAEDARGRAANTKVLLLLTMGELDISDFHLP